MARGCADRLREGRRRDAAALQSDVFTKALVGPKGVGGVELTDEFAALLADGLAASLEKLPPNPGSQFDPGSNVEALVEPAGFEPATFRMQTERSAS